MKILQEKYPLGSIPRQQSAGRYINKTYHANLEVLAKKIVEDMTFLQFISSSTLEVGTGKSVFAQQTAEAYTDLVNRKHNLNLEFSMKNVVFNSDELLERAFELPKYSCLILDEGDDLDTHYYSQIAKTLRKFFRKCRQLNLFIIVILPNFFQVPAAYAITRSVCFVDVKFEAEFERGYFDFYSFNKKKKLYLKGKKYYDYGVVAPSFDGRFLDGYAVPEAEYRKAKHLDMLNDNQDERKSLKDIEKQIVVRMFRQVYQNLEGVSIEKLSLAFGVSPRTGSRWLNDEYSFDRDAKASLVNNPIQEGENDDGGG